MTDPRNVASRQAREAGKEAPRCRLAPGPRPTGPSRHEAAAQPPPSGHEPDESIESIDTDRVRRTALTGRRRRPCNRLRPHAARFSVGRGALRDDAVVPHALTTQKSGTFKRRSSKKACNSA